MGYTFGGTFREGVGGTRGQPGVCWGFLQVSSGNDAFRLLTSSKK